MAEQMDEAKAGAVVAGGGGNGHPKVEGAVAADAAVAVEESRSPKAEGPNGGKNGKKGFDPNKYETPPQGTPQTGGAQSPGGATPAPPAATAPSAPTPAATP